MALYFQGYQNPNNLYKRYALFDWDEPLYSQGIFDSNAVESGVSSAPDYLVDGHWIWEADGTGGCKVVESTGAYAERFPVGTQSSVDAVMGSYEGYPPYGFVVSDNSSDNSGTGRQTFANLWDIKTEQNSISITAEYYQHYPVVSTIVTSPANLPYVTTYNGVTTLPSKAGKYHIVVSLLFDQTIQSSVDVQIDNWYFMQDNFWRIEAFTLYDLYLAIINFRVNTLQIPIGYVSSDLRSFLWSLKFTEPNSIPPTGWNYCDGSHYITASTRLELYQKVANYRQDNGIELGEWLTDVDTYLASLASSLSPQRCSC